MTKRFENMDDAESIFFAKELEAAKSKSYDIVYADLKARKLFPVDSSAGSGAESIKYEQYDSVGMGKLISSYADDLPRADVKGKEFLSAIKSIAASYGWSLQEIRAAKFAGKPLEQRRANAAKRACLQKENQIAFFGDADNNLGGLLSNANIPVVVLPADGTGASALWSTKTADQIIRDMHLVVNTVMSQSKGVEQADTLLLPIEQYNLAATKKVGVDSNMTVLKYFLETSPYVKNVEWVNELDGAGTGGLDVMVAYKRDPDKLTLEVPQDFEQLDVQVKNLEYTVPCHMRSGGLLIYYPLSLAKAEGL